MDPITQQLLLGAAGAGGDPVYVDDVFSTYTWDGTGSTGSITNGIDLTEGGLVWTKVRDLVDSHTLADSERGKPGTYYAEMASDSTYGSQTTRPWGITSFNSNGFSYGGNNQQFNRSSKKYVSWTFRKQKGFFDVVKYTGNESNPRQIAHNLGSVPGMIIVKGLSTSNWYVYHRSLNNGSNPGNYRLRLDTINGMESGTSTFGATATSTHFTISTNCNYAYEYVAYVFAHDDASFGTAGNESIIKCGSFTSTSSWGNFKVDLGFEPQFVMYKRWGGGDYTIGWHILDTMRGYVGPGDYPLSDTAAMYTAISATDDAELLANSTLAEATQGRGGPYSQGFLGNVGQGNKDYIYIAIRRPHKPPEAATEVFGLSTQSSTFPSFTSGFPVDFYINRNGMSNAGNESQISSRPQGPKTMKANQQNSETGYGAIGWDYMTGFAEENQTVSDNYAWMFKRAPGFMDVVAYTGTGSARTVNHNLTVVPEMMIVKKRSSAASWQVYHSSQGNTKYSPSFRTDPFYTSSDRWNSTTPTSTQFSVGTDSDINGSTSTYIAYLFATLSGISKVGSYSGTGNVINVDCGFTNGARFILIKRTDAEIQGTGGTNWYVWDTLRGIVSGNDPYLLLNTDAAQVTNTDYVDPLSTGFTVTASGATGLNVSGGTYMFLAIA